MACFSSRRHNPSSRAWRASQYKVRGGEVQNCCNVKTKPTYTVHHSSSFSAYTLQATTDQVRRVLRYCHLWTVTVTTTRLGRTSQRVRKSDKRSRQEQGLGTRGVEGTSKVGKVRSGKGQPVKW